MKCVAAEAVAAVAALAAVAVVSWLASQLRRRRPQGHKPTAAAAVQAADAVPALEAAAALPVAADVQSHSDECKESPTSLAVPHGKGPACLGATDVSYAAAGQDDQFVRDEHARARAADASWEQWWRRLMDRGTVVEGILILDADTLSRYSRPVGA